MTPIRILICDDHPLVRSGLAQLLAARPRLEIAAEATDAASAVHALRRVNVDVVLLDIALPGRDGLDVLKQLRSEFPGLPVLMLSTYPEKQYALRCLKLGAAGYLSKSADPDELVEAVRRVADGGTYLTRAASELLAQSLRHADRAAHETLSQREYQVFLQIAGGRSATQIAESLSLSPNTVSTYRARIMEKLATSNDVETALYAVRHSLVGESLR